MSPCGGFGVSCGLLQPGKRMLVIFGPKKCGTQSQIAAWILRSQFKILLEVRSSFPRVLPESRARRHCVVAIWLLPPLGDILFVRCTVFRHPGAYLTPRA